MPEYKDIVAILATLVASFVGAWVAFSLESQRRDRETRDRNVGAGSRALYTIFNLWNTLEQYRKEALEPCRGRADAWLNLAAHPALSVGEHRFQASDLQFLLQSDHAQTYAGLFLEEQRFALAIQLIRIRSELVLNEVFPKMAAAGFPVGRKVAQDDIEQVLGIDLTHKLKEITASIYKNVDEDLLSLVARHDELRSAIKKLYPNQKVIQVVFSLPQT
ncbi:hypothetical protein [Leeia sp.]|uniref:hypothetical protein n=1 Tax=Leeia sp. TaxID=2884678 RepID=UPI0035B4605C